MSEPMAHKGWTEESLRRVLPHTSSGVKSILVYVATHPRCTTRDMARDLHLKSERSVGPTLNNLSRTSIELGVFPAGRPRWPFQYGTKTDGYERYDMPAWVRHVVLDVLGKT